MYIIYIIYILNIYIILLYLNLYASARRFISIFSVLNFNLNRRKHALFELLIPYRNDWHILFDDSSLSRCCSRLFSHGYR